MTDVEEITSAITLLDGIVHGILILRPQHPPLHELDYVDSPRIVSSHRSPRRPLVVHFSDDEQCVATGRQFARQANATVLIPNMSWTPELWLETRQHALEIIQKVASTLTYHYGADLEHGFILSGLGLKGANVAAVVIGQLSCHSDQFPLRYPLTGLLVMDALLLTEKNVPSLHKNTLLAQEDRAVLYKGLLGTSTVDQNSSWFSPMNMTDCQQNTEGIHRHPPTYLQTNIKSPVAFDMVVYAGFLTSGGNDARLVNLADNHEKDSKMLLGLDWLVEQVVRQPLEPSDDES